MEAKEMEIARMAPRAAAKAALAAAILLAALLAGCVANDDNAMPWAAPDPNESTVNLPGSFARP